mgnify:CR=1
MMECFGRDGWQVLDSAKVFLHSVSSNNTVWLDVLHILLIAIIAKLFACLIFWKKSSNLLKPITEEAIQPSASAKVQEEANSVAIARPSMMSTEPTWKKKMSVQLQSILPLDTSGKENV